MGITQVNTIKHTALKPLHLELGARMVPFAGYEMPVQYAQGIKYEHNHTRTKAGLFDISHMGQIKITGDNVSTLIETLVPADIAGLPINQQRYTVFTNSTGGIMDDLMITNKGDHLLLVVNAACKDKDLEYLQTALSPKCIVAEWQDRSLLALQGPEAVSVLEEYDPEIAALGFMRAGNYEINGIDCLIHRCGYTGEDGFEISAASANVERLARMLLQHESVEPVGLGARDSLRLEAGLCLYGHDMDENTTPVEASLAWVVAKKYRNDKSVTAKFPGAEIILVQLRQGTEIIRTGLKPAGKMPVREGTVLLNEKGDPVGRVTSGGYGQTVNGPIAMGYVKTEYAAMDTKLKVSVRGRDHKLTTTSLPFVAHRYHNT